MDILREDERCGICGQPMDAHEAHQQHEDGKPARKGGRISYVVVEVRGATVHYQETENPGRRFQSGASDVAGNLRIDISELPGCHFTCWVEPTQYGVIRSDFQLA
ncbi:hypothetical protein E3E14_07275 [Streptomyces sp. ICN441]|nr:MULTISPECIES: hypothetical protein [Streptomyces]TFE54538.1 hypothetical protein E3E14_07275 [Streptomyces sp. ICN441]